MGNSGCGEYFQNLYKGQAYRKTLEWEMFQEEKQKMQILHLGTDRRLGNGRLQYQAGKLPQYGLMLWQLQIKGRRDVRSNMKKNCQEISGSITTCEETEEAKITLSLAEGGW